MRRSPGRAIAALDALLKPASTARRGMPVLDPRRWSGRHSWFACGALAVATAAGVVVATRHASQFSGVEGLRAFLAAGFGLGMIGLAASLGGLTVPGFLIGLVFIAAGISSWTYPRAVTWAL